MGNEERWETRKGSKDDAICTGYVKIIGINVSIHSC